MIRRERGAWRWMASALAITSAHAGAVLFFAFAPVVQMADSAPPPAVIFEIETPAPLAQLEPAASVPEAEEEVPPPQLLAPAKPEPEKPKPKKSKKAKPRPVNPEQAQEQKKAVAAASAAQAAPTASPVRTASSSRPMRDESVRRFLHEVLIHLERHKRYPRLSRVRHEEGVVHLRIALNMQGQPLETLIEGRSGYVRLDEEAAALIARAAPLPPPPPEIADGRLTLTIPIRFSLE